MSTPKISHICLCIDFFHKVLHDFQVKNSVSRNKRIEHPDIQVVSITSSLFVNSFVISLGWTINFNLDFVLESFRCSKSDIYNTREMCSVYNFTKWTHKTVVGKSRMMKLRKIDTEDMENELTCDSNDLLYLFSVFTFRSVRLTCKYTFIYNVFLKCMMIPLILWAYKVGLYILPMNKIFFVSSKPPQWTKFL